MLKPLACQQAEGNLRVRPRQQAEGHPCPKLKAWQYDMQGHARQCVEKYLELSGKTEASLKAVGTPCLDDHMFLEQDFTTKGDLSPVAARIVLKALYLARMNRPECLWTINHLARHVTCWNAACDKRLHRLISYLHHHGNKVQVSWVGDKPEDCSLILYSDADFAGGLVDSKSTSGAYLVLVGPRTFVPLSWFCKKQGAVSHSSSESEIIALEASARLEGLPALILWEQILEVFSPAGGNSCPKKGPEIKPDETHEEMVKRVLTSVDHLPALVPKPEGKAKLTLLEDNEAVIKMTVKGRSPNMRHITRTHRVDLDWLFERLRDDPGVSITYVFTKAQVADFLTKGNFTVDAWLRLCFLANIHDPVYLVLPDMPEQEEENKRSVKVKTKGSAKLAASSKGKLLQESCRGKPLPGDSSHSKDDDRKTSQGDRDDESYEEARVPKPVTPVEPRGPKPVTPVEPRGLKPVTPVEPRGPKPVSPACCI